MRSRMFIPLATPWELAPALSQLFNVRQVSIRDQVPHLTSYFGDPKLSSGAWTCPTELNALNQRIVWHWAR
ncbi:hypothetical protein BDV41DRAFT_549099 [Aspergillus transmontanensis]|uniref:Uncharacterized protein n=1 Tax=Aspergillus transmontanensis TaxID=1034304 RepID=A0A5N6VLT8_9EURO|nr:hypothetical protein BDV41DRAFT_549099 [Aspergillus transmontanensis]